MENKPEIGAYVYIARLLHKDIGVIGHRFHVASNSKTHVYPQPHEISAGGCWHYENVEYVEESSSNYEIY